MNEQQMRDRIDEVLGALEHKLQPRRRSRLKLAGPAAGMMLALDACIKPPVEPAYGVEIDAAASDSQQPSDAATSDLVVLYGVDAGLDAGPGDVIHAIDAAIDAGPDDRGLGDLTTIYGIADAYGIADNG